MIRSALDDAGVPAVINGAGSVFGTPQAREWLRLLEALERPSSMTRAHSAALTMLPRMVGRAGRAAGRRASWEHVHERLHDWARMLRVKGVASLTEAMMLAEGLPERLLATDDGERRLTDLRHVASSFTQAATTEQMGTTALTAWLRRRIAEAGRGHDERGAQPATRIRRRGRSGPDDPSQQGTRVPDRLPARSCGSRATSRTATSPVLFHDADADDVRDDRRRARRAPTFDAHQRAVARSSSAAKTSG